MIDSRPSLVLMLGLVASVAAPETAQGPASEGPQLVSVCSDCWPLSSAHPGSGMVADGAGGVYIVCMDFGSHWRLRRLRNDLSVPKPWPVQGLSITSDRPANRIFPVLAADGHGGVFITWVEQDADGMSVWLLRVTSNGQPAKGWPASGVQVATTCPWANYPDLAILDGGIAVGWMEMRNQVSRLRLAAFDAEGRPLKRWPPDGITLSSSAEYGEHMVELASDGRAGVFALWTVHTPHRLYDLHVAYVPEDGSTSREWTIASQAVPIDAMQWDRHPEIEADGRGAAIVVWTDERSQERRTPKDLQDVFAQRISTSGRDAWSPDELGNHAIAAGSWYQLYPHLAEDGKGGAFFSWNERGPGMYAGGRLKHIDAQGNLTPGWPKGGVELGIEVANLVPDLRGGVFALWTDSTGAYLQRFDSGSPSSGALFSFGPTGEKSNVQLTPDGRGGAFLAWEERKGPLTARGNYSNVEVRVQHVTPGSPVSSIVTLPSGGVVPQLAFAVHPIAPNPAHARCRISFDLPRPTKVVVDVFDVAGRRIERLADRAFEAGAHSLSWSLADRHGRAVAAGLYLVRVTAGEDQAVSRVTIVR